MASALEDFSRRPLQYKAMVFAGVGALLGLLYWQFMLSPLRKERDAAAADLDSQKAESSRLKQQKKHYDELVADETKLKAEIEQNQKALPTEAEMPAFLDMLSRKTGEAGVEMLKRDVRKDVIIEASTAGTTPAAPAKPGAPAAAPATPPASFIKVPVDLEITGTFYQIKKFMASLRPKRTAANAAANPDQVEEKDRIVTIESLTITDPKVKNNEIILTARFVAATFRAKQDEAPATPPKPAAPATPARPATPAGQPKGPVGTSKVKTEAAMDASEVRAQKAAESDGEKLVPAGGGSVPPKAGLDRLKGGQ